MRSRKRPWCFVNSKAMCVFIIILNCRGQNNNHLPYLKFTKTDSQDSPFRLKFSSLVLTQNVPTCYGLLLPAQTHLFSSPYYHQTWYSSCIQKTCGSLSALTHQHLHEPSKVHRPSSPMGSLCVCRGRPGHLQWTSLFISLPPLLDQNPFLASHPLISPNLFLDLPIGSKVWIQHN